MWKGAGEEPNYHQKAAAFIETCYCRAKVTLSNNNPLPWKPIKGYNKHLACLQCLVTITDY